MLNTYIHTYIHTNTHAYIHTYIHTYVHTYIDTYRHRYIDALDLYCGDITGKNKNRLRKFCYKNKIDVCIQKVK